MHSALARSKEVDPGQFITIARFFDPFQAHLVKSALEDHEILTVIQGEYTGSIFPRLSLVGPRVSGGIQVQVPAARVEEALRLLDELESRESDDFDYEPTAEEYLEAEAEESAEEVEVTVWCPACGGSNTHRIWFRPEDTVVVAGVIVLTFFYPIWAVVAGVLLTLLKVTQETRWRCGECKHRWREGE
jgi:hypothetical protein